MLTSGHTRAQTPPQCERCTILQTLLYTCPVAATHLSLTTCCHQRTRVGSRCVSETDAAHIQCTDMYSRMFAEQRFSADDRNDGKRPKRPVTMQAQESSTRADAAAAAAGKFRRRQRRARFKSMTDGYTVQLGSRGTYALCKLFRDL